MFDAMLIIGVVGLLYGGVFGVLWSNSKRETAYNKMMEREREQ